MAKKKRMTEGKKNIIAALLQEYEVETAEDVQEALKDLLGGTLEEMLQAEMTDHLGYEEYERTESENARNGSKTKSVRSKYGELEIAVPQDRKSSFEPKVVGKRKKDISGVDDKIIAMYAKGLSTRQISEHIEDIYGFEVSESFVSDVTDRLLPQIEEWQQRPLASMYPIVFIDAVHYSALPDRVSLLRCQGFTNGVRSAVDADTHQGQHSFAIVALYIKRTVLSVRTET